MGSNMDGIRQVLCVMTLLGYHLIVCYVLSSQEGDLKFCDEVLSEQLTVTTTILFIINHHFVVFKNFILDLSQWSMVLIF